MPKYEKPWPLRNFLVLAVNFPVTSQDNTNLYHIFVTGSESNAQVFLKLNREKFNGLNAEIDKEFNDGIDLDESTIHIKLVNDQRKSITMISNSVFINKNPILESELLIDRRKSKNWCLPDFPFHRELISNGPRF